MATSPTRPMSGRARPVTLWSTSPLPAAAWARGVPASGADVICGSRHAASTSASDRSLLRLTWNHDARGDVPRQGVPCVPKARSLWRRCDGVYRHATRLVATDHRVGSRVSAESVQQVYEKGECD